MDYGFNDRRKTKNDKKAKVRYNKFKRGGSQRAMNFKSKDEGK